MCRTQGLFLIALLAAAGLATGCGEDGAGEGASFSVRADRLREPTVAKGTKSIAVTGNRDGKQFVVRDGARPAGGRQRLVGREFAVLERDGA